MWPVASLKTPSHKTISEHILSQRSAQLSLGFSCVGHTFSHLFAPIFYVVALSLETELGLSHGELISLIVVGNVLFGVAAPAAGWLGDKWSATGMMVLYFFGTGVGMTMVGFSSEPFAIGFWLAVTGLFASIYHPVGIAWLVRNAEKTGTALGINGVFGGIGPGVAALVAAILTDAFGWRSAFAVPGILMLLTGGAFFLLVRSGVIVESKGDRHKKPPASKQDMVRAFIVLAVTMLCTGLIYQATQAALPKMFAVSLTDLMGDGVIGVGMLVAMIYFVAGGAQIVAGKLADHYPLKLVYLGAFILQVPVLFLAAGLGGGGLFVVALVMVTANVGALPAENALVARYAPSQWRSLAFGLKFILAFGLSGLGAQLEAYLFDTTGGFDWLFTILTAIALVGATAIVLLPSEKEEAAQPAE